MDEAMENTESIIDLLNKIWKQEQENAKALAEQVNGKYQLPPAAPLMIRNLATLLAELQKLSFYHGATAMLQATATLHNEAPASSVYSEVPVYLSDKTSPDPASSGD